MKEFKGTPGPWRVDGLDVETEDFYVCNVGDYTLDDRLEIEVGKAVSEANANLIAAALSFCLRCKKSSSQSTSCLILKLNHDGPSPKHWENHNDTFRIAG